MRRPERRLPGLYDDVERYDAQHEGRVGDETFYLSLARRLRRRRGRLRVFEAACGTGRIARRLAAAGHLVVGTDLSGDMVARARRGEPESGAARRRLRFEVGDMRDGPPGDEDPFDLAVVAHNSFSHLHDADDALRTLQACRGALGPDGHIVLAIFTPDDIRRASRGAELRFMDSFPLPRRGGARRRPRVRVYESSTYDESSGLARFVWYYEYEAGTEAVAFTLRLWEPQEIRELLEQAGFELEGEFGNYRFAGFRPGDELYIPLARMKAKDGDAGGAGLAL